MLSNSELYGKSQSFWKAYSEKLTWAFIMVFLLIFPLFVDGTGYAKITEAKYHFFVWTTSIYLGLIFLGYIAALLMGEVKFPSLKQVFKNSSLTQKTIAAFLLVVMVSAAFSPYKVFMWVGIGRYDGLLTILLYCLTFFTVSTFGKLDKWHILGFMVSMSVLSVIGLFQYFGVNVFGLYPTGYNFLNSSFITTVGNINMTSGMLCIAIPLFVTTFIVSKDRYRFLSLAAGALCLFVEVICRTDGGLVGLAVSFLILIPIVLNTKERFANGLIAGFVLSAVLALKSILTVTFKGNAHICSVSVTSTTYICIVAMAVCTVLWAVLKMFQKKINISRKMMSGILSTVVIVVVVGGIAAVYFEGDRFSKGPIYEMSQMMHGNFNDRFGSSRMFVWKRCIPLIKENPIIGTGPDSFLNVFMNRYTEDIEAARMNVSFDFAHNDYIQIMINYGILGLIAYLTALFGAAKRGLSASKFNPKVLILGSAVLCYCVQIFFSFSIVMVAPVFWILFALLDKENRDTVMLSAVGD